MKTAIPALLAALLLATPGLASPIAYDLDKAGSRISFSYTFGKDRVTGSFPDFTTDILIDFDNPPASKVAATIRTGSADGGFPFASQALTSSRMLASERFPHISFASTAVSGSGNTARVLGDMTVRGVTRPVELTAKLYRDPGSDANERRDLTMVITGQINRNDFGVSGWGDEVGPMLDIEITAHITAR